MFPFFTKCVLSLPIIEKNPLDAKCFLLLSFKIFITIVSQVHGEPG